MRISGCLFIFSIAISTARRHCDPPGHASPVIGCNPRIRKSFVQWHTTTIHNTKHIPEQEDLDNNAHITFFYLFEALVIQKKLLFRYFFCVKLLQRISTFTNEILATRWYLPQYKSHLRYIYIIILVWFNMLSSHCNVTDDRHQSNWLT